MLGAGGGWRKDGGGSGDLWSSERLHLHPGELCRTGRSPWISGAAAALGQPWAGLHLHLVARDILEDNPGAEQPGGAGFVQEKLRPSCRAGRAGGTPQSSRGTFPAGETSGRQRREKFWPWGGTTSGTGSCHGNGTGVLSHLYCPIPHRAVGPSRAWNGGAGVQNSTGKDGDCLGKVGEPC